MLELASWDSKTIAKETLEFVVNQSHSFPTITRLKMNFSADRESNFQMTEMTKITKMTELAKMMKMVKNDKNDKK